MPDITRTSKRNKRLAVVTAQVKAAAIVRDTEAYQCDTAARVDAEEGIRQGLEGAKKRKIRPA